MVTLLDVSAVAGHHAMPAALLFPLDVLDEIWDVIESVSEGFLTYFCQFQFTLPHKS